MQTLVTHSSRFHADDVFAAAALQILHKDALEIIRTRDAEKIDTADIVIDVGGMYDPARNRFDHHQSDFTEVRDNGIPYASFGLIWRHFGKEICGSQEVADVLEQKIVQPIDAGDNGIQVYETKFENVHPYSVTQMLYTLMPSWKEEKDLDEAFLEAVDLAKNILKREITRMQHGLEAQEMIEARYAEAESKQIVIFNQEDHFDDEDIQYVLMQHVEPLLHIRYRHTDDNWSVKAVWNGEGLFGNRIILPKAWAGLQGEEFQKVSGVSDAVFCHRGLFMCVAQSKEGAIALAQKAVDAIQ